MFENFYIIGSFADSLVQALMRYLAGMWVFLGFDGCGNGVFFGCTGGKGDSWVGPYDPLPIGRC